MAAVCSSVGGSDYLLNFVPTWPFVVAATPAVSAHDDIVDFTPSPPAASPADELVDLIDFSDDDAAATPAEESTHTTAANGNLDVTANSAASTHQLEIQNLASTGTPPRCIWSPLDDRIRPTGTSFTFQPISPLPPNILPWAEPMRIAPGSPNRRRNSWVGLEGPQGEVDRSPPASALPKNPFGVGRQILGRDPDTIDKVQSIPESWNRYKAGSGASRVATPERLLVLLLSWLSESACRCGGPHHLTNSGRPGMMCPYYHHFPSSAPHFASPPAYEHCAASPPAAYQLFPSPPPAYDHFVASPPAASVPAPSPGWQDAQQQQQQQSTATFDRAVTRPPRGRFPRGQRGGASQPMREI